MLNPELPLGPVDADGGVSRTPFMNMYRNSLCRFLVLTVGLIGSSGAMVERAAAAVDRPNVVVIITDDQGYSDVGFNGNPHLRTPVLDRLAAEATVFDRFYANTVCSLTRASLMTGRDAYRTGVVDTQEGMSVLRPAETTLAEALREGGYRTGLVGKWHLGDNAPGRPQDQGFDYALTFVGGMIGTSYNPLEGNSYFDPELIENGESRVYPGYCTDIFTDAALGFIREASDQPFFLYLAPVVPHHPLSVPDRDAAPYRAQGLSEETARFYGMLSNLDYNVGRLLEVLREEGVADNTLVVFLGDNGTSSLHRQADLWESGLRGRKTSVYEGGLRVPMLIRPPASGGAGIRRTDIASVNDVMPTILDYCDLPVPAELDGLSLRPLIDGEVAALPSRALFAQFHRGVEPIARRNFAVIDGDMKLVQPVGQGGQPFTPETARFELYDLARDPAEEHDLAAEHTAVVQRLRSAYEAWFADVGAAGYAPVRTWIGDDVQPRVRLTRQDWQGGGLDDDSHGIFPLEVRQAGFYGLTFRWSDLFHETHRVTIKIAGRIYEREVLYAEADCRLDNVYLPAGPTELEAWVELDGERQGVRFVDIERGSSEEAFKTANARSWQPVFFDPGTGDWTERWFLDGKVGTVENAPEGMTLRSGPEAMNDAHHMVLWSKESFAGDLRIEFDYTRLDDETKWVNILFIQATGSGAGPYAKDISTWQDRREVPAMSTYFNHMHTYHVSYAAFPNDEDETAYIRARRYMPESKGLNGTDLVPDYFPAGLFAKGVPHHITVIKQDRDIFVRVRNAEQDYYCHFSNVDLPVVAEGRVGLRQMFTRASRYANFRVSAP